MSKGLEALKLLKTLAKIGSNKEIIEEIDKNANLIKQELKALEIIKEKEKKINFYINDTCLVYVILTKEEYDLLKEVLL